MQCLQHWCTLSRAITQVAGMARVRLAVLQEHTRPQHLTYSATPLRLPPGSVLSGHHITMPPGLSSCHQLFGETAFDGYPHNPDHSRYPRIYTDAIAVYAKSCISTFNRCVRLHVLTSCCKRLGIATSTGVLFSLQASWTSERAFEPNMM